MNDIDHLAINTIRALAMDAVQAAGTGHPGTPMGAADSVYTLWMYHLKHNPKNPNWINRDRFILSAGHASMLLYSLLYLTGYDISLDQIKKYRQYGGITPGHPELNVTPGIDVSTGLLGQGVANAVGLAIAQAHLAAYFNRPGHTILDNYTYVFAGDGDLMEGVSAEAASLAGHLRLSNLILIYDNNHTTIEGSTDISFTEDSAKRFEAYQWHVQQVDGYDLAAISDAINNAKADPRPSMIISNSHMAYGSPNKQDDSAAHGAPLGENEVQLTKQALGWPLSPLFYVPDQVLKHCRAAVEKGPAWEQEWKQRFDLYRSQYPDLAAEFDRFMNHELQPGWDKDLPVYSPDDGKVAPRKAISKSINAVARRVPNLIGGSADLGPSTSTIMAGIPDLSPVDKGGRNMHFGVREHGMAAILSGMALFGGLISYGSTYFVFADYMRPAIRMAAFMRLPVVYIFTHDSVLVGTDGPTHQPVEHLFMLRMTPNLTVIRPCDANETVAAWKWCLTHHSGPVALILARHDIPVLSQTRQPDLYEKLSRGGYILAKEERSPADVILMGTGSEVHLLLEAQKTLSDEDVSVRVVNFPSLELFEQQSQEYKNEILPLDAKVRLAVEAGSTSGWWKYVGFQGAVHGVDTFGIPGSTQDVIAEFKFTPEEIVRKARVLLNK
jgi:transketolase